MRKAAHRRAGSAARRTDSARAIALDAPPAGSRLSPRLLSWAFFLAAVCCAVAAALLWLDRERAWADPRPAVLNEMADALTLGPSVSPRQLVDWSSRTPELLPLVLRSSLRSGEAERGLALLDGLDPQQSKRYSGWRRLLAFEAGDHSLAGRAAAPESPTGAALQRRFASAPSSDARALYDRHGRLLLQDPSPGPKGKEAALLPRHAGTALLPRLVFEAFDALPPAHRVRTTLDLRLSQEISWRLDRAIERLESRAGDGVVVILGAADSELLAAVSGSGSPTHTVSGHLHLRQQREPASVAKLITTSAAYRAGHDVDRMIADMTCTSAIRLGSGILYCPSRKGSLNGLDHAMATSCNMAFADIGRVMGARTLLQEYESFGLGIGVGQSEHLGFVPRPTLSNREYGDLAIGLNYVDVTPLHSAILARTMVDGHLIAPRLLLAGSSPLGLAARPLSSEQQLADSLRERTRVLGVDSPAGAAGPPLIEPATLTHLQSAMRAVVRSGGTAAWVAPRGLPVAMKTGTGRTNGEGYHVNYIGFTGDPSHPRAGDVAFSLRLTGGRSSRWVRREAKQLTRELLQVLREHRDALLTNRALG